MNITKYGRIKNKRNKQNTYCGLYCSAYLCVHFFFSAALKTKAHSFAVYIWNKGRPCKKMFVWLEMSNKGLGSSLIPQLTSSESKSLNHSVRVSIYLVQKIHSHSCSIGCMPSCLLMFTEGWMEGDWPNHDHDRWSLNQFIFYFLFYFINAATSGQYSMWPIATLKEEEEKINFTSVSVVSSSVMIRVDCCEKKEEKKRFKIRHVLGGIRYCRFPQPIRKFTILCNRYRCARL